MRRLVLTAAESVLQDEGMEALSIRDLAARTGYSPSALYKHFSSKEDVVASVKEAFMARLLDRMRAAVAKYENAADRLHAVLKAYVEQGLEQPNHFIQVFCGPARAVVSDGAGVDARELLHDTIRLGIARGEFADQDVDAAGLSVWASVHGLTLIMSSDPAKWADPGKKIDEHVHFTISALRHSRA